MNDRVKGLWVAFDKDIKDEDIEPLANAIRMMKHVADVTAKKVNADDWMLRNKINAELREKLSALIASLK